MENENLENDKSQQDASTAGEPVSDKEPMVENNQPTQESEEVFEENVKPAEVNQPVDETESLKKQIADLNDRYIRLMAEFDNYKKRISREYERQVDSANEKLMIEMVEVRENFERALRSAEAGADFAALYEGMKLIFNKFDTVLNRNGLETFASAGDVFDPQIHDALMKTPKDDIPEDHIAEIYERGYKLKSKVIKHAKVIVSSGPSTPDANK